MLRIAEALGRRSGALALVTGESVGQVASQTLHNLARVDEVADLPVLRPLIGMDKLEITAQAQAIGTFEISIEPDADCCTLFVPRHPGTRTSREEVAAVESRLDVAGLVAQGVDGRRAWRRSTFPRARAPCAPCSAAGPGAGAPPLVSVDLPSWEPPAPSPALGISWRPMGLACSWTADSSRGSRLCARGTGPSRRSTSGASTRWC